MAITKGRSSVSGTTPTLKVGDAAPAISLPAHNADEPWTLASARGTSNVVLAFYPFAFTPV
jgi:peroxiredoxin